MNAAKDALRASLSVKLARNRGANLMGMDTDATKCRDRMLRRMSVGGPPA
jgi:hypothetical protein